MSAPLTRRHPAPRCSPRTQSALRRRPDRARTRPRRRAGRGHAPRATSTGAPLASLGGTGVFVSALRDALLAGEVDVAVHSLKDLPTGPADGIALAAVPLREDPRDVARRPRRPHPRRAAAPGSRVGTGSPRRVAQLGALGLGLEIRGRSAATSTPGSARSPRARSTPWSSPAPDWPGSAGSTRSPRCSTRCRCFPPPGRERWRSSAAPTTPGLVELAPRHARRPGHPGRGGRRARRARRARGRLLRSGRVRWPRSRRGTTGTSSGSGRWRCHRTVRWRSEGPRAARSPRPRRSGAGWRRMLAEGAATV